MKNKKMWIWIAVAVVVVVLLIVWAISANNKAKQAALQQAALNNGLSQANQPPTSTIAQILNSLFPFYSTYQSGSNNNNTGPGGANNEPGTPLGDYCAQYPDSILCTG